MSILTKSSILRLIGRSPVRGLRKHLQLTVEMSSLLEDFFAAMLKEDFLVAQSIFEDMNVLEQAGDRRKDKVRRLNKRPFMMAFPRREILKILNGQEKIMNLLRDSVVLLVGRKLSVPASVHSVLLDYIKSIKTSVAKLNTAILELDDLVETGFGHVFREHVLGAAREIDQPQQCVDEQEVVLRHSLFVVEGQFNTIDLILMYQSIEKLGRVSHICEEISSELIMLVEN
jgi:predicted phosphate transport protein (TIGR00153 family)